MATKEKRPRDGRIKVRVVLVLIIITAVFVGAGAGLALAGTVNVINQEDFTEFSPALPTKILDIKGRLITEFSAEEKRELVSIDALPEHLIYAVIAREDQDFYTHRGFSVKGIMRAALGVLTKRNLGGGSTITQQVAGTLYADRSDRSIIRKLRELWWAIQIERRFSKNEILELYLNKMYMGAGTYGVEAASKYYFGHSAKEITLAESAILVIQLSSPARYNPLDNPNIARDRQIEVLNRMVSIGFTSREEADASFQEYWDNYDYTRVSSSAYLSRKDEAPWFSEYVRRQLSGMLYGSMDLYKDGLTVHTTLDLDFQKAADRYIANGLEQANRKFREGLDSRFVAAEKTILPVIDMLSLAFGLDAIHASSNAQNEAKAQSRYTRRVNPIVDAMALLFNISDVKVLTGKAYSQLQDMATRNTVEGAFIALENETGYIKALVGGSKFDQSNQLIRATQGNIMPGSSFKPLYYSAAIDSRKFTPATLIYDSPVVFFNEDNTPYIPNNYKGEWKGSVLLWYALAHSMNIPSLKILDAIGFDAAINRASSLLGITDPNAIRTNFQRYYPLALGVCSVTPLQMAKAYATFANQGKEVTPIAIRVVEDRNGKVILDPEKELRLAQKRRGAEIQILSQQTAYVMTNLLQNTVQSGTLAYASGYGSKFSFRDENNKRYTIPAAGKTGTTQNWADAWTVGFTPYYTAAVWFGFDRPGNSLGTNQTGAVIAGPVWANFMNAVHQGLPTKDFQRPASGLIEVEVCSTSGLLPTENCGDHRKKLTFLAGTQPTRYCDMHEASTSGSEWAIEVMRPDTFHLDDTGFLNDIQITIPNLDFLSATPEPNATEEPQASEESWESLFQDTNTEYNPLLD